MILYERPQGMHGVPAKGVEEGKRAKGEIGIAWGVGDDLGEPGSTGEQQGCRGRDYRGQGASPPLPVAQEDRDGGYGIDLEHCQHDDECSGEARADLR